MANVKISQLPSWTGSSADLRWFVMNNSGETQTFKFSGYTSPFRYVDDTLKNAVYLGTYTDNSITSTGTDNIIFNAQTSTIYGNGSKIALMATTNTNNSSGNNTFIAGGSSHVGDGPSNSGIIGGYGHFINGATSFIGGGNNNNISNGYGTAIIGGSNNTLWASNSVCLGGNSNYMAPYINSTYCGFLGGDNNEIGTNSSKSVILGGNDNTITSSPNAGIIGASSSTMTNSPNSFNQTASSTMNNCQNFAMIGGHQNSASGCYEGGIFGSYGSLLQNGTDSTLLGGRENAIDGAGACCGGNHIIGGQSNSINYSPGTKSVILGGNNNNIRSASDRSFIVGGQYNTIVGGTNGSIINSKNSSQNSGGTYNTDTVVMVGCENTDVTNSNNSVVLGISGRTLSGLKNTTVVDKLLIYGNTTYESTTFNEAGDCNIDIFNMSTVIINATGGTYNLNITPEPSQEGTPELTLLINYSAGATINFASGGNVQWRWGNGAGAPTFTAGKRSIIKMAAWAGNDLWEISRSMNMS